MATSSDIGTTGTTARTTSFTILTVALVAAIYIYFVVQLLIDTSYPPPIRGAAVEPRIVSALKDAGLITPFSLVLGCFGGPLLPWLFASSYLDVRREAAEHLQRGVFCQGQDMTFDAGIFTHLSMPGSAAVFLMILHVLLRRRMPVWVAVASLWTLSIIWEVLLRSVEAQVQALPHQFCTSPQ